MKVSSEQIHKPVTNLTFIMHSVLLCGALVSTVTSEATLELAQLRYGLTVFSVRYAVRPKKQLRIENSAIKLLKPWLEKWRIKTDVSKCPIILFAKRRSHYCVKPPQ